MLSPRDSRSRDCRRLDGLWRFRFDPGAEGTVGRWWRQPLPGAREMPVPASYNDLVTDLAKREHVGAVWYQRGVPASWAGRRVVLRCDAATHRGTLWADDVQVADHAGGYTPFEADLTDQVRCGAPLRVTVRVSNELTMATIPPGLISRTAGGRRKQRYFHDFFNYAGLHRPVWLYSTPRSHLAGLPVSTAFDPQTGMGRVTYRAEVTGAGATSAVLRDAAGDLIAENDGPGGVLAVPEARSWCPQDPYMYRLQVRHGEDEYWMPVGSGRSGWTGPGCCSTGSRCGCAGSGCMRTRRCTLKWLGANSFRTSYYPYAEEVLDYADRQGVLVIDETPAVGLHPSLGDMGDAGARTFGPGTIGEQAAAAHLAALRELISRDRHHPSVIAWSIANEPDSVEPAARDYFAPLAAEPRKLDPSRPVCFANVATAPPEVDEVTDLFGLICVNRYSGWYAGPGDLAAAERDLERELRAWAARGKPILVTEFGADALPGLHALPPTMCSEEYQEALITMSLRVFGQIPEVICEHV